MYLVEERESRPVESVDDLVTEFRSACKPRQDWRLGTEHELIGVYARDPDLGAAPPFEGDRGINAVFESLTARGWEPVVEDDIVIALTSTDCQITLEPGGQIELAGRPVFMVDDMAHDVDQYIEQLAAPSRELGIAWLGVGFRPFGNLQDVPRMPKQRYKVMRSYLPTRGHLALEMMHRTATVQTSIDFSDADDAGSKLRCVMSVTSILTALYANSPIVDGKPSGYQSYRAEIWRHTDLDRCGLLPFVFDDGDVFRNYAEWALDVPMFFVHRGGYRPAGGMTFRQFMRDGFEGHRATLDDWGLHLSTLFPEGRLKSFLEVRGCDCGSLDMVLSMAPLLRGLLYDDVAREHATALTAGLSFAERVALAEAVPRVGMAAPVGATGLTAGDLARQLMTIAREGLERQALDELPYLEPLDEIALSGRTPADHLLDLWDRTAGEPTAIIAALAHPGLEGQ